MDHLWSHFLAILILIALASSDQGVLIDKPECDSCSWNWTILQTAVPGYTGWYEKHSSPRYLSCINNLNASTSRPNSWLRSDKIAVNEAKRLDVTVRYLIIDCSFLGENGEDKCVNAIDLYVNQSNQDILDKSNYPNPLSHTTAYEKIAELGDPTNVEISKTISVAVKGKFIFLAFHNNGACSILYSVKVSYNFCPEKTFSDKLLVLPRTAAPVNVLDISRVERRCKENAVHLSGSLNAYCNSSGQWNKTSVEGRCICKEDLENVEGKCQACPNGKYNDEKGFNCTSKKYKNYFDGLSWLLGNFVLN
ncbi:ephrin type-A receptor 6-like [Stylophora pistillata]|uniref:ephrin type-A receptor 6-like n=1 Tax=Stylophora pistillata TaxID=50429 RepID=UPI000C04E2A2|nr:ephrin type-A receptor 6-like [Stylophora pistillata]